MNWESERDMARDVEENPELYQALSDDGSSYKTLDSGRGGEIENERLRADEIHWWSIDSKIQYIRTSVSVHLMFLWASVIISLISGMVGYWDIGLAIMLIVVLSLTIQTLIDLQNMIEERGKYE